MPRAFLQHSIRALNEIKLFLCDVDGVLTDGSIFIGGAREIKRFHIPDGLGLIFLRRAGFKVGWVSARPSPVTKARARELKIDFLVQQGDRLSKTGAVEKLLRRTKLDWERFVSSATTWWIWDRCNGRAWPWRWPMRGREVKAAAHYVTRAAGGHGAVRETVEMILKAQRKWDAIVAGYRE